MVAHAPQYIRSCVLRTNDCAAASPGSPLLAVANRQDFACPGHSSYHLAPQQGCDYREHLSLYTAEEARIPVPAHGYGPGSAAVVRLSVSRLIGCCISFALGMAT